jgi:mRNA interferase MazF
VVKRGDICWIDDPDEGRRPALVLTRDEAIPVIRKLTVAYLTRTIREIPTEVRLSQADGLPAECVVNLDNIRQVPRVLLDEPIVSLTGEQMHEVCRAMAIANGCHR